MKFLAEMDNVVPWSELCALIEPVYPKTGEHGGGPPLPLHRMLRVYFLQLWFDLCDPGAEEALHDAASMRAVAGVDNRSKLIHTILASAALINLFNGRRRLLKLQGACAC